MEGPTLVEQPFEVDLDTVLKTTQVQVLQSLDVEALKATLRWLVDRVKQIPHNQEQQQPGHEQTEANSNSSSSPIASQDLQDQIGRLLEENQTLKQGLNDLKAEQAALSELLNRQTAAQPSAVEPPQSHTSSEDASTAVPAHSKAGDDTKDLSDRVSALEAKVDELAKRGHTPETTNTAPQPPSEPATPSAIHVEPPAELTSSQSPSQDAFAAGQQEPDERNTPAAKHNPASVQAVDGIGKAEADALRASVGDAHDQLKQSLAAVAALRKEVEGMQNVLKDLELGQQKLGSQLSDKASQADVSGLAAKLGTKADRAELDALLQAGASVTPSASAEQNAAPAMLEDGSVDTAAVADLTRRTGQEVSGLKALLLVLQERLAGKADADSLSDLAGKLSDMQQQIGSVQADADALRKQLGSLASDIPAVKEQLGSNTSDIADMKQLLAATRSAIAALPMPTAVQSKGTDVQQHMPNSIQSAGSTNNLANKQPAMADEASKGVQSQPAAPVTVLATGKDYGPQISELQKQIQALIAQLSDVKIQILDLKVAPAATSAAAPVEGSIARLMSDAEAASSAQDLLPMLKELSAGLESKADRAGLEPILAQLKQLMIWKDTLVLPAPSVIHQTVIQPTVSSPVTVKEQASKAPLSVSVDKTEQVLSPSAADGDFRDQIGQLSNVLIQLEAQIADMAQRLAGKADLAVVNSLEIVLNSKADLEDLGQIKIQIASKADLDKLGDVEMRLATKADQEALDALKIQMALLGASTAGAAPATNTNDTPAAAAPDSSSLLASLQQLLADKASKAELDALRSQLGSKAGQAELEALKAALGDRSGAADMDTVQSLLAHKASQAELAALSTSMGDVFAELERLRSMVNRRQSYSDKPATPGAGAGSAAASPALLSQMDAFGQELQNLRDRLDTVAHAANILAIGRDTGAGSHAVGEGASAAGSGGHPAQHTQQPMGKENRLAAGAYDRLVKLLGQGQVHHKMDLFDPELLAKMAQKLAALEAQLSRPRNPSVTANAAAPMPDFGLRDLEKTVKRLGTDLKLLKERMGMLPAGGKMADGDYAMLSSKPLLGYRCMACDRPLDKLDDYAGPYIPTNQVASVRGPKDPPPVFKKTSPTTSTDTSARGPQNWYEDARGAPAGQLPKEDVGPKLPPGGWRGNNTGLPAIPPSSGLNSAMRTPPRSPVKQSDSGEPPAQGAYTTALPNIS